MRKKSWIAVAGALLIGCVAVAAVAKISGDYKKYGYSSNRYETFSRDAVFESTVYRKDGWTGAWALSNMELPGDRLVKITVEAFERTADGFTLRARVKSHCSPFRGVYLEYPDSDKIVLNLSTANDRDRRIQIQYQDGKRVTPGNWMLEGKFVCTQAELDACPLPGIELQGKVCVSLWKKSLLFR